jgi:putative phage-type endonuclease
MIEQGSPEWHQLRLGKVTASRMADLTARTKTGWGAVRDNYMAELLVERLTGKPADGYVSPAMQWGKDTEPRAAYEFLYSEVRMASFIDHPSINMAGASPDGFVAPKGLVEFKCPDTKTHLATLVAETIPGKYRSQMQWQMACTETEWCDWVSFDPRVPEAMQFFVQRVRRDDDAIASLEKQVAEFLRELDAMQAALMKRFAAKAAA